MAICSDSAPASSKTSSAKASSEVAAALIGRGDLFEAIEYLRREGESILARFARSKRGVAYADLRFEVVFNRAGAAVGGEPRDGSESESAAYSVSVHVAGPTAQAAGRI